VSPEHMVDVKYLYWAAKEPEKVEKVFADAMLETVPQDVVEIRKGVLSKLKIISKKVLSHNDIDNIDNKIIFEKLSSQQKVSNYGKEKALQKLKDKKVRRNHVMEKFSLKKPIYENCQILAPDGEILCKCDRKKVEWYLDRDLADLVKEDPLTARLKFEPSGRGITAFDGQQDDDEFYTEDRTNQ